MTNKQFSIFSKEECKQISISLYGKKNREIRRIYIELFKKKKILLTFKDMVSGYSGFKDLNEEEKDLFYKIRNSIYFDNKFCSMHRKIKSLFKKKLYKELLDIAEEMLVNKSCSASKCTKKSIYSILKRISVYLGNEEESKKAKKILDYIKKDKCKTIFNIREISKGCMSHKIHPCIVKDKLEYYKNIISVYKELKTIGWEKTIDDIKNLSYEEINNAIISDTLIIERLKSGFNCLHDWYKEKRKQIN